MQSTPNLGGKAKNASRKDVKAVVAALTASPPAAGQRTTLDEIRDLLKDREWPALERAVAAIDPKFAEHFLTPTTSTRRATSNVISS